MFYNTKIRPFIETSFRLEDKSMFYNIFLDIDQLFIRLNKTVISPFGRERIIWQERQSVREMKTTIKKTTPENQLTYPISNTKVHDRNKGDMIFKCSICN